MPPAQYLEKKDPTLGAVIKQVNLSPLELSKDYFRSLVESIVSQQLSVKAADTIFNRFLELCPTTPRLNPAKVAALSIPQLRSIGLSGQKAHYIQHLANTTLTNKVDLPLLQELPDEEVILRLTQIKGIGRWTAEMFLIFSLGRPDIFSYGDLGLRNAMRTLYSLRKDPSPQRATQISNPWRPYRSLACRYLWASLETID